MDIVFIPNYLTKFGKELIKNRVDNFISLMLVFGHVSLLRIISENLNFSLNKELKKLNDKYFF